MLEKRRARENLMWRMEEGVVRDRAHGYLQNYQFLTIKSIDLFENLKKKNN